MTVVVSVHVIRRAVGGQAGLLEPGVGNRAGGGLEFVRAERPPGRKRWTCSMGPGPGYTATTFRRTVPRWSAEAMIIRFAFGTLPPDTSRCVYFLSLLKIAVECTLGSTAEDHFYRWVANNPARYIFAIVSAATIDSLEEEEDNENVTGWLDATGAWWLWRQT